MSTLPFREPFWSFGSLYYAEVGIVTVVDAMQLQQSSERKRKRKTIIKVPKCDLFSEIIEKWVKTPLPKNRGNSSSSLRDEN